MILMLKEGLLMNEIDFRSIATLYALVPLDIELLFALSLQYKNEVVGIYAFHSLFGDKHSRRCQSRLC